MELVFVTHNPGKLAEINNLLGGHFKLKSLDDLGFHDDIPETNPTLEENASAKARYIYDRYLVSCFADDTGLEVGALNNQPGVLSARYADSDSGKKFGSRQELTEANIEKLLRLLKGKSSRKARFRTVISLIIGGRETLFEGVAEGEIGYQKSGREGFGYDPVFIPSGFDRTFAEMSMDEKNRISHRAIAFGKLVEFLKRVPPDMSG
jgi:XTP/dITP diphosphohydrolase